MVQSLALMKRFLLAFISLSLFGVPLAVALEAPLYLRCHSKIPTKGLVKGKDGASSAERLMASLKELLCFGGGTCSMSRCGRSSPSMELFRSDFTEDKNRSNDLFEVIHSGDYLVLAGSYRSGGARRDNPPTQVGFVQVLDISKKTRSGGGCHQGKTRTLGFPIWKILSPTPAAMWRWRDRWEKGCFLHISRICASDVNLGGR